MIAPRYVIGMDFGTLSGRAVLVDANTGYVAAQEEREYEHGVITTRSDGSRLPMGWAIQEPEDYLQVLESAVSALVRRSGVDPRSVVGLAFDVTACTMLPTRENGTPISRETAFRKEPHAKVKLWKHLAAQNQCARLERAAAERMPGLLDRYGGKVSSQWMVPKVMQIMEEAPEVFEAADLFLEVLDWMNYRLTGTLRRNTCFAGFKSFWNGEQGYPDDRFLAPEDERLAGLFTGKLRGRMAAPWDPVGRLTPEWAGRLGLTTETVVGAGIIDAHSGVLGSGITGEGTMVLIMGTSTCHLLLDREQKPVPGICGSSPNSILPGYHAYEAGQACVGDMLEWFVENQTPAEVLEDARTRCMDLHQLLSEQAGKLCPGECGLLALDWWNGQRSPLVDDRLTGLMVGVTLRTTPADQYRALMEATAFGTRMILENFEQAGMAVSDLAACGGIARKNPVMMQIYADVLQRPIRVAASDQSPALGAAILAAAAAGVHDTVERAVEVMTSSGSTVYLPNPDHGPVYDRLYRAYAELADHFGRGGSGIMMELGALAAEQQNAN